MVLKKGEKIYKEKLNKCNKALLTGCYSGLNENFKKLLEENNINFKREFSIFRDDENNRRYIYDFFN